MPGIPVEYSGRHSLLGQCYFAKIRNRLISIPRLLKADFTLEAKKGLMIVREKNGKETFSSTPDGRGLYHVDIFTDSHIKSAPAYLTGTLISAPPSIDRPMSALEIKRAKEVIALHQANGHPSMESLSEALDNGAWPGINLTSHDIRNALKLFGPCSACQEGKMTIPSEPSAEDIQNICGSTTLRPP